LEKDYPDVFSTAPQYSRISIKAAREDSGMPVLPTHFAGKGAREALKGKTQILSDFIGGCGCGRIYCCIQPNGDVWPCVFMPIKVDNVREKSFEEIWLNNPVLNNLRDRSKLKGHCKICEFKNVCGGCRARAYGYFKDVHAPDPGCIYNKKYWDEIVRAM
jgi:radical SAM protein with 4Fe4S-binding SPASM domain